MTESNVIVTVRRYIDHLSIYCTLFFCSYNRYAFSKLVKGKDHDNKSEFRHQMRSDDLLAYMFLKSLSCVFVICS